MNRAGGETQLCPGFPVLAVSVLVQASRSSEPADRAADDLDRDTVEQPAQPGFECRVLSDIIGPELGKSRTRPDSATGHMQAAIVLIGAGQTIRSSRAD